MKIVAIIPARYNSSRLPGKPLKIINGQTMLFRVWKIVSDAIDKKDIYVATDDLRIANHCKEKKINFVMTSKNCLTGTDRIAEASKIINADIYINIQGDEPLLNKNDVLKVIKKAKKNTNDLIKLFESKTP